MYPSDSLFDVSKINNHLCTLSGRKGKVVASDTAVALSIPAEVALIYTMH